MEIFRHPHYIRGFTYMDPQRLPAITHCGEATYSQSHQSPVHTHPGFEFIYLSRGTATRYQGSHQTEHKMGEVYIAYPNEKHEVHCQPGEEGHQLWIGLRLEKLGAEGAALRRILRTRKPRAIPNCQSVETVLQGIIRQMIADRPLRQETIRAYLHTFCLLLRQAAEQGNRLHAPDPKSAWPYTYMIQKAVFHMESNLGRRLSLAELASVTGAANASRFCTQFREEVKVTPAAYHLQLRLAAARRALAQPSSSVTAVAMEHGFGSTQHFCGAFRRAYGTTASDWKKQERRTGPNSFQSSPARPATSSSPRS